MGLLSLVPLIKYRELSRCYSLVFFVRSLLVFFGVSLAVSACVADVSSKLVVTAGALIRSSVADARTFVLRLRGVVVVTSS